MEELLRGMNVTSGTLAFPQVWHENDTKAITVSMLLATSVWLEKYLLISTAGVWEGSNLDMGMTMIWLARSH